MTTKAQAWSAVVDTLAQIYAAHAVPFSPDCADLAFAQEFLRGSNAKGAFVDDAMAAVSAMLQHLATGTKYKGTTPPMSEFFQTEVSTAEEIWYALQGAAGSPEHSVVDVDDRPSACVWDSLEHRVLRYAGLTPTDILDEKNKAKFISLYQQAKKGILVLPAIGPKPAPKALPTPPQPQTPTTIAALYSAAVSRGYTGTDGQWTLAQLHYILRTEGPKNGAEMQKLADAWMAAPVELVVLP